MLRWKVVFSGIDNVPKSEIEKRKRNMESISQEEKREMSRSVFWYEKRMRIFVKKKIEKSAIISPALR